MTASTRKIKSKAVDLITVYDAILKKKQFV